MFAWQRMREPLIFFHTELKNQFTDKNLEWESRLLATTVTNILVIEIVQTGTTGKNI